MHAIRQVVILDTETGGLDPLEHSLLSVGLVSGDGERRLEIYVCEPELRTTPDSMAVNRIDLAHVRAHGLAPVAAVAAIEAFLDAMPGPRPVLVAGHNVAFDLAFMRRLYRLAGRPFPRDFGHRTIDTHSLIWALGARGRLPPDVRGSDAAFAHFDIAPPAEARHTALGDALATRELLRLLLELILAAPAP
jgi:DNA polymerase-3 subunit epsilon